MLVDQPKIHELVVYPIEHPSLGRLGSHKPFLVTNGRVPDTVINAIRSSNLACSRMKAKPLTLNSLSRIFLTLSRMRESGSQREAGSTRRSWRTSWSLSVICSQHTDINFAAVKHSYGTNPSSNTVTLVFNIDEGPKAQQSRNRS